MQNLEEKAKQSAHWTYDLINNNFSVYKDIKAAIKDAEKTLKLLTGQKKIFQEIYIDELKSIETSVVYYKDEFNRISFNSKYAARIKINDDKTETKWISINKISASELIKILTDKILNNYERK